MMLMLLAGFSASAQATFQYVELDATYFAYQRDVGDVDGDGDNDVVAVQEGDTSFQVFRAPDWTRATLVSFTGAYRYPRADDFKVADIDSDGDLDLVTGLGASPTDNTIQAVWCENLGNGSSFNPHVIGSPVGYVKDIVVVDLDRNGRRDVVMRLDSQTQVWLQETNGSWTEVVLDHPAHEGLEAGDLDRDGDPDLILNGFWFATPNTPAQARVATNYTQHVIDGAWFNQGGDWTADSCKVVVGDFDGDGTNDVAFSHSERAGYDVAWYRSSNPNGAGPWVKHAVTRVDYGHNLQAADFDLDGKVDLLVGGMIQSPQRGLTLMRNQGGGLNWTPLVIQTNGSYSAELGDIDQDGDLDLVGIRNWDSGPTWIYRNNAAGPPSLDFWFYQQISAAHVRTFSLCFPDVNGDGQRDLASGSFVYLNPGPPLTGPWTQIPLPDTVHAFATLDVDGDNLADLIAQQDNPGAGRIDLYWVEATNAAGTAWNAPLRIGDVPRGSEPEGFQGYAVAQLVAGARPEIIVNSPQGLYYLSVPASNPESGNWPRTLVAANNSEEGIGVADIDNDGDLDLSFTHGNPHEVKWARNPGDGSGDWAVFTIGTFPEALWPDRCAAADLNGDGRVDMLVTEENYLQPPTADNLACWWEQPAGGATNGNWTRHTLTANQYTLNSLDVGDVDRDGDVDVVLAEHRGTRRIGVWANDGAGHFTEHRVDEGKESHLGGRLVDLDADGDLDLVSIAYDDFNQLHLWRNDSPGEAPPTILGVVAINAFAVRIQFSEPVETVSAQIPVNYSIDRGVSVTSSILGTDNRTVLLSTSLLPEGTNTLTVNNVFDRSSPPCVIATNSQASFAFTPDSTAPVITSVLATNANGVSLVFSEPVEETSAEATANYAINNGVIISNAFLGTDSRTIMLTTSPLGGGVYTLTVSNVSDLALPPNTVAPGTQTNFFFIADPIPPVITNVIAVDAYNLRIEFSEPVETISAQILTHYSIDNGVTVTWALLDSGGRAVTLATTPLAGGNYTLTVSGVTDRATPPNSITPNSQTQFTFSPPVSGTISFSSSASKVETDNNNSASLTLAQAALNGGYILVGVSMYDPVSSASITTATYDGTAMAFLGTAQSANAYTEVYLFGLAVSNKAAGNYSLTLTASTGIDQLVFGVAAFANVRQTSPTGPFASATGWDTAPSVNVSSQPSDVVVDILGHDSGSSTLGANQTQNWKQEDSTDRTDGVSSRESATATTTAMSHAKTVSAPWSLGAVALKPGGSPPGETTPPTLIAVAASNPTTVRVLFSEPVSAASAQATANYSINNGVTISSAILSADTRTVTLTTSTLGGGNYTLTVNNVTDRASPANTIAPGSQAGFSFTPPAVPAVISPTNNSVNVGSAPTLAVSVEDLDAASLTVVFHGRATAATPGRDFTLVAVPDTQYYVSSLNGGLPAMMTTQIDWIVGNRSSLNIQFVTQLGDCVQNGDNGGNNIEWLNATNALYRLENPLTTLLSNGMPYAVAVGNHDQSPIGSGDSGTTTFFNQYFGVDHFIGYDYYGGHFGADNDNSYQLFSASGMDFIIIHLEYDTTPSAAVLTWADNLLKTYPNRRAIVTSHWIVNLGFNATFGEQGQQIYDTLKNNTNFFLMLCGHVHGEGQRTDVFEGRTVHSVLSDYQERTGGGNGWLRYYVFSPSNNVIRAHTYSPWLNQAETDADSQFDLPYQMSTQNRWIAIGTNAGVASGSTVSFNWGPLAPQSDYEWYVTVSDGYTTTAGPVSRFTTAPADTTPPTILSVTAATFGTVQVLFSEPVETASAQTAGNYSINTGATITAAVRGADQRTVTLTTSALANGNHTLTINNVTDLASPPNPIAPNSQATFSAAFNQAPLAVNDAYDFVEDGVLNVVAAGILGNDTDSDADQLAAVLLNGPVHGTLTLNADGSFTYVSANNYNGADSFTYHAFDGIAYSVPATVSLTVLPANDAPEATGDNYPVNEDTVLNVVAPGVLSNDTDVDGEALNAVLASGPSYGTLTLNPDGSFAYAPINNYSGHDAFAYRAHDGTVSTAPATVVITVMSVNEPPVAVNDNYDTNEDTALNVGAPGVLGNDTDEDGDVLTAVLVTGPAHGTLSLNADGSFDFIPRADYHGPDSFTYRARGGGDSIPATVSINVVAANDLPLAANDNYSLDEDAKLNVSSPGLLSNDTDADGDTLTVELAAGPLKGALTLSPNGSFDYTPNTNYNGPDHFTYRVLDGSTSSGPATVNLTILSVNDAPLSANDSFAGDEDTVLHVSAPGVLSNDNDADADSLTAMLESGPQHGTVTLDPDGSFIYTPANNYNGPDHFSYRALDGVTNSPPVTVNITVAPLNDSPLARSDNFSVNEGTVLNITASGVLANDSDADGDTLTAVLDTGPSHGTLVLSADGGFTYTPEDNYNGSDSFIYSASDGAASSGPVTVSINVKLVDLTPPIITSVTASNSTTVQVLFSEPVEATSAQKANNYIVGNGVIVAAALLEADTRTVTLTTSRLLGGDYTLTVNNVADLATPANLIVPDSQGLFAYTNHAPVAADDDYVTGEDTPLGIIAPGVLGNDSDPDGDTLSAALETGASHGSLTLNSNGSFTYIPANNYHGFDTFTYQVQDGVTNSAAAKVTITILPANDAPVAMNDSYDVNEDAILNASSPGVLGNDSDADGEGLLAELIAGPLHGVLSLSADGSFTFVPAADYHGPDGFTYRALDGDTSSAPATVSLTVLPMPDRPVAGGDVFGANEDTVLDVAAPGVLANDSDLDGDSLAAGILTGPSHGTLNLNGNGGFLYTPAEGYTGSDSFTYLAWDGANNSDPATVNINVSPVNDPPVAVADSFAANEDIGLNVSAPGVLGNDADAEGNTLTVALETGPSHGALTLNSDGSFTYTPANDYSGPDSFSYRASDGATNSSPATVTVTVMPVNDAPAAAHDNFALNEDGVLNVSTPGVLGNDADADGDNVTAELLTNPVHGALTLNAGGSFVYTPSTNYNGPDSFTYRAADGFTNSAVTTVALMVQPVNDEPLVANDSFDVSEDTSLNVIVPGLLANDSDLDGDSLSAELVTNPSHGTILLSANGSFTYTPTGDFNGNDSFTYRASDGSPNSVAAMVNITVLPVNDAPLAGNNSYSVLEGGMLSVLAPGLLANDTDADGEVLTAAMDVGPLHGALTLNGNGSFDYTPAVGYSGPDSFTYRALDSTTNSAAATVTITVLPVDSAPPTITSVTPVDATTVHVLFSEPVEVSSAQSPANYSINNGVTIISATLSADPRTVNLTTSTMPGGSYTLTINNVADLASTPNLIAPDSRAQFSFTPPRVTAGLVALYPFNEGVGTTVHDVSGVGTPLDLTILDPAKIQWRGGGGPGVQFVSGGSAIRSPDAATKVCTALMGTSRLTLEVWVTPASLAQSGPARIATVSQGTANSQVNVHLAQNSGVANYRLRTTSNSTSLLQAGGLFTNTVYPRHVVVTYDGVTKRLYMDGVQHSTTQAVSGTLSNWNTAYPLILGNEATLDRSWLGTLYLVAIYDRSLSLPEIQQNYNAGSGVQIILPPLPAPWQQADIGTPAVTGSATHSNGVYTVEGAGTISSSADSCHNVYQLLSADGEIRARVFSTQDTGNSARAGVMIRESLNGNSRHAMMNIAPNGTFRFQRRTTTGGSTSSTTSSSVTFPNAWVRLVRSGNTITAYRSANGSTWTQVGSATITMASEIYVGLGVASGSSTTLNNTVFDNVTVIP